MKLTLISLLILLMYASSAFSQELSEPEPLSTSTPTLEAQSAEIITSTSTTATAPTTDESTETTVTTPTTEESTEDEEIQTEREKNLETLLYGLDGEVTSLVTTLISQQDDSYATELAEIFDNTRNSTLKDRIITYFSEFNNPTLKEYALYLLEDPYDEKKSTVNGLINYIANIEAYEAAPLIATIIDSDDDSYFNAAVLALGKIGGAEEALFLVEYLENDLTTGERQSVVRALADIKDPETYEVLAEMADNSEENSYVRMYAAEAIGSMNPEESTQILVDLYDSTDPNLREYAIKGITENSSETATKLILSALKDDHFKVRLQAIESISSKNLQEAGAALLYRAKNDTEATVKNKCYDTLASFNYKPGIEYMIELLNAPAVSDSVKANISSSLIKHDVGEGIDEVVKLALKVVTDDKKKSLRYALGKEFAKYENDKFKTVCAAYLASKDVSTQGTGLDIFKKNPYPSLKSTVQSLTEGDVANSIKAKAKSILEAPPAVVAPIETTTEQL